MKTFPFNTLPHLQNFQFLTDSSGPTATDLRESDQADIYLTKA